MNRDFDFDAPPAATPTPAETRDVYTPSRLNREARTLLERGFSGLWLEGEISNLSRPASGHWYFSLKDQGAQLRAAMFRQRNMLVNFSPKDGAHVLARGRVSLYEPRGDYQFLVDYLEEAGEGALRRQFEQLKAKLQAAGLFAPEAKKKLPALPRRIGVITSPTGAALRDILHILRRRFCCVPVLIYPVPVQGAGAAAQIAAAIKLASARAECDVLILARGGGSLEDLWSFNEEVVAQAIFACRIPLVSGVGHEIDFTIADFVADVRAPTPSGAAELVVPDCQTWHQALGLIQRRMLAAVRRTLAAQRENFVWLRNRLGQLHPGVQLRQRAQRTDELEQRLIRAMRFNIQAQRQALSAQATQLQRLSPALRLADARGRMQNLQLQLIAAMRQQLEQLRTQFKLVVRSLQTLSPLATLDRGYAIVLDAQGHVISEAAQAQAGDRISTRLAKGKLLATVDAVERDEK